MVILAAGLGTRMKSKRAKVLHRAGGLSLIEHVVQAAGAIASAEHTTVVVGHQAEQVRALLAPSGVRFVEQTEQKGTGHALLGLPRLAGLRAGIGGRALWRLPAALARHTLTELVRRQAASDAAATLITTRLNDPTGYGRIIFGDQTATVRAIVEHKAATPAQLAIPFINSGIYCFRADLLWKHLPEIRPDNPAHEYYLTDIVEILGRAGHTVAAMEVENSAELLGINTRAELAAVDKIFRERKVQELMLAGVTIEKPETVTIDSGVRIGEDSIVEPFAQILGRTEIGEDCRIGACSIVRELHARIQRGNSAVYLHRRFAHRNGRASSGRSPACARETASAETRASATSSSSRTRASARAQKPIIWLIWAIPTSAISTNIGAGTITCNYDGVSKHQTQIGKDAFVGSNSTLVAPLEIGDGSYIGAGSVITEPVPPDALALGRARQVIKKAGPRKGKRRSRLLLSDASAARTTINRATSPSSVVM